MTKTIIVITTIISLIICLVNGSLLINNNDKNDNVIGGSTIPSTCGTPNFTRLATFIDSLVSSYDYCEGTEWAVSDFGKNYIESATANISQETASTIKLWVMLAVMEDIQNGLYTFDSPIFCSGSNMTVDGCLSLMIGISDNCATYDLTVLTKMSHVNQLFAKLGMNNSQFHHWCFSTCPGYVSPCQNDDGSSASNSLSSHDVVLGLTQLYKYQILPVNFTAQAYKYLLTAHGWHPMLGLYVPAPVAHKQGWLPADEGFYPFTENDEATVFTECGEYAASVMITRNWTNSNEDATALELGAEIGRYIYCTFVPFGYSTDGTPCSTTLSQPLPGPGCSSSNSSSSK